MSVKNAERKAQARERRTTEAYRHHSSFNRCPKCGALVKFDDRICWKCGVVLCE